MHEEGKPAEERASDIVRVSSQFLGHGMTFAVLVALFGLVGFEVGMRVGAESLMMIFGIILGGSVGFYNLYVQVATRPREEQGHKESDDA